MILTFTNGRSSELSVTACMYDTRIRSDPTGIQPSHRLQYHSHPDAPGSFSEAVRDVSTYVRHTWNNAAQVRSTVINQPPRQHISRSNTGMNHCLPPKSAFRSHQSGASLRVGWPCLVSPGIARIAKMDQAGRRAARLHGSHPPAWRRRRNAKGLGSTKIVPFFLLHSSSYLTFPPLSFSWIIPRGHSTWTEHSDFSAWCEVVVIALREADDVANGGGILSYICRRVCMGFTCLPDWLPTLIACMTVE